MTGIVFEPLVASPDTRGDVAAALPPLSVVAVQGVNIALVVLPPLTTVAAARSAVFGSAVATLPALDVIADNLVLEVPVTVRGYARFQLPGLTTFASTSSEPAPVGGDAAVTLPPLATAITAVVKSWATGAADLPALHVFAAEAAGNRVVAELPPLTVASAESTAALTSYVVALATPMASILGSSALVFQDSAQFGTNLTSELLMVMQSRVAAGDTFSPLATLVMALKDSFAARAFLQFQIDIALADQVTVTDAPVHTVAGVMALASYLMAQDRNLNTYTAVTTVVSGFVLADRLRASVGQTITSAVDMTDVLEAELALIMALTDAVLAEDTASGSVMLVTFLSDTFNFSDEADAVLSMIMELVDTVGMAVRVRTPDGDEWAGYTVNTRTAAVTEQTNYKFNSLATVDGVTYGLRDDGLYAFGGDTDAGTQIAARLRTGLHDFGTSQIKGAPVGYIGYTTDGMMVFKLISTDGGKKKENHYRLLPRSYDAPAPGKVKAAKGIRARYFGFELANLDGADFALDSVEVWVTMTLQRRTTGRRK